MKVQVIAQTGKMKGAPMDLLNIGKREAEVIPYINQKTGESDPMLMFAPPPISFVTFPRHAGLEK